MCADKFVGTGQRASTGFQVCVPQMLRMNHVGPDLERYSHIRSTCGSSKTSGISKQCFHRSNLNNDRLLITLCCKGKFAGHQVDRPVSKVYSRAERQL